MTNDKKQTLDCKNYENPGKSSSSPGEGEQCYGATCPSGAWVKSNQFYDGEIQVTATDGNDCIAQCSAMPGYNLANMPVDCNGAIECWCQMGPASYSELVAAEDPSSDYTNCFLSA